MPKTLATQRSLKSLRDNGWSACIVEKFLPAREGMKFPRRIDAFGFGDILACRPPTYGPCPSCHGELPCLRCNGVGRICIGERGIALVQCCPGASHAEHKEKILAIPEFQKWKDAGGLVFLQSWAKKGPRGKTKRWTMREEEL